MEIKILSPEEFAKEYKLAGKMVKARTVVRRCEEGRLPKPYKAKKVNKTWIILIGFD